MSLYFYQAADLKSTTRNTRGTPYYDKRISSMGLCNNQICIASQYSFKVDGTKPKGKAEKSVIIVRF